MNGLASPSSDALRSLSVVSELQFLWRCFASATVPSEKRRYLVQFLNQFVSEFADTESDLVELRFGGTRLVARDLVWHFISHISELCQAGGDASTPLGEASKHAPAALIFEYLSGLSREGEGFYLLWTLEILAKNVSNARIANGLATTLVAILVRLLELPADFLLRREARAHYPHVPAFYAFHFPLVSQLFAVDDIPTCLAFLDTMASPSSSSSPSSPPPSSSSSLSSASSLGGVGGAYGLGGMPDIPANAMLASLCYHMLSVLSHLFKYPGTLKELVQYKKLSAFVGLFKPLSAGTERRKSNKQKATADLYGSGRSGALKTANSKAESVGYALDAFGIFAVQRQLIRTMASLFITSSRKKKSIELIHQQRVLQQLLSNLYKYGDRLSTTTCLELCQLIVFALRSSFALSSSLLDDFIGDGGYQILTHNLIVTSKKGSREEIAKFIGLVTHLLFIGDRNVLFSPPAASASSSSSSSSADYAQPTRGHGKQHSTRSDPDEENKRLLAQKVIGDEASGNWRNLDSCKILFNALVSCGSTEVKTDLLRTLQVILSLRVTLPIGQSAMAQMLASSSPSATSSASTTTAADQPSAPGASRPPLSSQGSGGYGQALLGGASAGAGRSASGVAQQFVTVTGYQLLQKRFEPFRTLFLQYDTLTLHNQRMVLGMMDDVLRGSDLLTSELKSYCGLLQGKRPSTILLVANHLISLIQRGKIRRTVLKSVGIVPILLEYLANPLHLYCASALIGNDERQLCLELLQPPAAGTNTHASSSRSGHTAKKPSMSSKGGESESESEEDEEDEELQETCSSEGEAESDETIRAKSEAAPAAELNAHTSKDDEVRRILYALSRRMLKLTFHFLVGNAGNQDAFRRDNGLRRLYAMLNDVALRGPILRVVAIIAIGSSSSTPSAGATIKSETGGGTGSEDVGGAIIRDIISVLQSSGGTSALSKEILSMRRDILVALCYMFRHNAKLKDAFRTNGGFIWAISVMNGIGKSIDTEAEEAKEKDAKQAHQAAADSTQPSEGVDDGAVDPESNGDAATAPRSPAPAPASGSGPEASQEAFTFIKMLLNTLSIALTANVDNRRYFRSEIRFAALAEALQACHFVIHVGQRAIEICDALIDVAVRHSWPPSCPTHYKKYVTIYNKEREKEEKRKRDDEARERRRRQHHAQDHASDFYHYDGNDDHDGEADTFMSARRRSRSFSAISSSSSFSAWASSTRDKIIEETVKSCGVCRGQLEMENPEIFKIIIQLLASAQGRTDDRDICYILNKLTFLATLSPSNQHQIAGVEVVCDLLDHFRGILTAGDLSTLTSTADAAARAAHMAGGGTTTSAAASISSSNTRAFLHSTVLRFVSKIASHSISLQALRKYLKLMKDPADFPVSLLSTLVAIAKRDGHVVPSYFLDFSNSKAGVALPSTEAKVIWPPPEGYTIAFWLNLTSDGSGAHPTSHGSGKRLRIVPGKAVSESHVTNIDLREHKSDEAATHIFTLNSANKQCQTEVLIRAGVLTLRLGNKLNATFDDFKFREKRWYHVAITHSPVRAFKQKVASVVKLSVDGLLRGSVPFTYPRPTSAHLFAFLGAPPLSYSLATGAAGASAAPAPASVPHRTESASQATLAASLAHDEEAKREASFQLGNLYLFEEAAEEPDVLFLYMLGPNYCGNLDVDLGMFQTYDIINADSVKLLAKGNPISPVNNPYMAGRLAAQRKGAPLSMGLEVSFSGEVPTRSAAAAADESLQWSAGRDYDDGSSDDVSTGGGDQQWADGRAAADSHALLLLDPSLYNDQMSHLDDTIVFLFSARNMVMAQAFRIDSFGTSRAPHQHHLNTSSLLDKEGAAQSTAAPVLQSPGGLGSATVAASPQPPSSSAAGAGAASSASSASTAGAGAGAGVGASPQKRSGKKTKNHILLANIAHHHDGVALRKRLSIQEMIFNIGGVTNLLWFLSTLPSRHDVLARFVAAAKKRESAADTSASSAASSSESEGEAAAAAQPAAGRSRVNREELPNEEELLSALPEAERLAYKIQIKECVERQRQAIRLLHSLLLNNARNVKELLDVSGYQLLARIIRKHRWTLDETLLSLMFNFVGLRKSRPQSLPYSSASAQAHSSSRMRAPLSSRSVPQFDDDSKKQAPTFIAKVKDLMRNESSTSRKGSLPTPDHLASFAAGGQQPTFAFTSPSGSGSAPATPQREHAFASAAFGPSIVFSDGVVANLPAFVHLILNRKLWGSASVSVQEIVFESLARLVANHEQASFNIMRFREAGLIDIFMRMFKEEADTLCIGFAPTLMVILRSIMTDPPYLTDLQKVVSYLIASHHKFGMARNLSSASPEGVRSISAEGLAKYQTTPARWRNLPSAKGLTLPGLSTAGSLMSTNTSTGMVGPGDEALRSIRVHVLQMLLDIVTSGGQQSIRVVESAMSLELLLEFIQHEDEETRIIILKLLDVFLRNSTNRTQFFQMKGWHLLGDILKPFKVGEELLAVLFAMLLGKPTHSYNAPNIGAGATSVTLNFLGKLSDEDIVLQHPGAMTTILVLVGSHFIMPNTRHAAIKTLHDIFLQNDPVKDQFISNHLIELLCDLFVVGYQEKFPTTPDNRAAQSQPSPGVSPYSSQQASSDLTPDEQQQTSAATAAAAAAELSCESCPPQPDRAHQAETAGAEQQDLSGDPAAAAAAEEEEEEEEGEVEEDEDKEWELEEDVLRFLKTVALHRCVTGTPSTMPPKLLDDIFLTMEVLEGLPREYVVRLRERVLVDVFWFFRDNNIANSSTLLNALQKLCVLALHAWLWRDSIVLLECRKVPASSKPWAYKARDMFKDNVLCMIFALFNILREKIDLTSTQAGLLLAPISLPQMQYRRALLRLLQSNVEPWILSALSKLLPAPTLSPGSSSSYLRSPLSSSLSELRSTNSMLLANIGDKEFVVSFLYHSWPLLAHPNPAISMQTQECWRIVIHSTLDYLSLATLEDLLLQAEQHVREANQRKRDREQQRGDGGDGDDKKKMEEEEKRKKSGEGEGGKEEEEWTRKVKAEQVEEILLEEHISHFVRRTEDTEANAKDKWQKERQKARKKKAIKIFRHKSKVKANGKSVKNHYFALQHEQEKANIQYLSDKEHEEQLLLHQWKDLVKKVTHQEAVWPLPNVIARPLLDATEGTTRMRIRLKPTLTRPLDKLFKEDGEPLEWLSPKMILRLQKLKKIRIGGLYKEQMQKNENHVALKPGEKVLLASKCQCITPFSTREGEMVVGAKYTYFFDMSEPYSSLVSTKAPVSSLEATAAIAEGEDPTWAADKRPRKRGQWVGDKSITLQYEDIKEIHKRRYLLKNTAMEIFLTTGRTYLLAFPTKQDRNAIYEKLLSLDLPNRVDYETEVGGNILKRSITEKWRRGEISNFEYLMHLNTLAGRSFNDLTQYPIFPFLLRDYTSEELDLTNPNTFRDLSKPMGAQDPTRLKKFIDKYEMLLEMNDVPYYYGSHYSNIGSVLHFLVRVQPFTRGFIEFQGGRFDVPDRVFHALDTTWSLSSSMSNSDVKELIPEFFYFPEFLENQNHFDLGIRHDSVRVDNVLLPPWAKGDPRIFIRKHREALECRYVSERLHQWIDLMYGALQRGDAARKAYNVFHPLTYEGAVEVDSIQDEVMRKATIAQISSYGQTPRLLFRRAHPEKVWREPEPTVYSHPHQLWSYPLLVCTFEIHRIDLVDGQPIPQRAKRVLLHPEGTAMVSWGYWDQNIRLCSVETGKVLLVIKTSHDDEILCADITQDGQYLATGGTSSLLKVWKLKRVKQASSRGRMRIRLQAILSGHAHDVLSVVISKEWSLIISGGREGKVILWDLNRLCYIRTLKHHRGPVTSLAISPTTGDIVTVDNGSEFIPVGEKRSPRNVSTICLWTINGRLVASTTCQERINCVALTHGTEGLSRNVVICGLDSGTIKIWDAFDLSFLSEMKNEKETSPITALCLNADFSQLFVGHANGALVSWSPRRMSNPAQLIKNLTLGRRKVTPLSSTSSTSVAIRKASRDLFEREAAAELARLNNVAEGGSSGDEAEQQQQQQQQHRQRSNSNNSMASSDSEGDSGAEIEEQS